MRACGLTLVRLLRPKTTALELLAGWSIASSVAPAGLVFLMLARLTGRLYLSTWLTLLFGLSATWWKFSTGANTYVPATFLLVAAAWFANRAKRSPALFTARRRARWSAAMLQSALSAAYL